MAHRPPKINLLHEGMAEVVAAEVDVEGVTTMNIIGLRVEVVPLIQVGVVELNHLRHHLLKSLLLALHLQMYRLHQEQALVKLPFQQIRVQFPVWPFPQPLDLRDGLVMYALASLPQSSW